MTIEQIAILIAVLVGLLTLGGSVYAFTKKFDHLENKLDQLLHQSNNHLELTGALISKLDLSREDRSELLRHYTAMARIPAPPTNPFTAEEVGRYKTYVDMAERGQEFTPDQVQDFRSLAQKYQAEHPDDENVWGLLGLVSLLAGLYWEGRQAS